MNISDYKYKAKYAKSNISKVYMHKCKNFPFCYYDKIILNNLEENGEIESYNKTGDSFIFSFLLNETDLNNIFIVYCEVQSMFTINISEEYIPEPIKPNNDTKPENRGLSSSTIGLIVGLVIFGVIIIAGLTFFFIRRYKMKNKIDKNFENPLTQFD